MVNFTEPVKVKLYSAIGSSAAFGHKSALDLAGATYRGFSYVTTSFNYQLSTITDVPTRLALSAVLDQLERQGILIKG